MHRSLLVIVTLHSDAFLVIFQKKKFFLPSGKKIFCCTHLDLLIFWGNKRAQIFAITQIILHYSVCRRLDGANSCHHLC